MTKEMEKIDLHMHTTMSDGTDTPEEIIGRVKEEGIGIFSVTDHDAINGCLRIKEVIKDDDPKFITGVEFNCRDEGGKYHILGYGYDPLAESINKVVDTGHTFRMNKVHARLDFVQNELGFKLPKDETDELLSLNNPGKPHIAKLLVKHGYAEDKEQAMALIDKKHFASEYIRPEVVIRGIIESGGIPVLAHPSYGSGNEIIIRDELKERVTRLVGYGLEGLEAYYSGFTKTLRDEVLKLAKDFGLYVTAGSDYHGLNKLVRLGDIGIDEGETATEVNDFLLKIM